MTSLVILQPLAAVCAAAVLLVRGPVDWHAVRAPLLLLGALAAGIVAQLIPLPPSVWASLPGHAPFARTALAAGLEQPWRPISLTPDLALASLVGLVVPLAALIGFASISPEQRRSLLAAILVGVGASAFFGLAQISGGANSPFYTYEITNAGVAVGLFANRNHQAVLLAMAIPMLAVWALLPRRNARRRVAELWIAGGFALVILPLLLITGSRAGLALGVIGFAFGGLLWRSRITHMAKNATGYGRFAAPALGVLALIVAGATVLLSRAEAVQRLLTLQAGEDVRAATTPVVLRMTGDFFPVGSGFGSFDPVYRSYEPLSLLGPRYLNHAHNDLLELIMNAGLFGILIAVLFLVWLAARTLTAWRAKGDNVDTLVARAASVAIGLVLLSSLLDYPLRTPLMMVIFTIECAWLEAEYVRPAAISAGPEAL